MKKTSTLILRNSLLLLATLFTISSLTATAQTKPAAARITQAIDEANLITMHSKVHPLARPEFDRGVVADSLPMNQMLLVLQRSPEQETALRNLMDEQQTKNSPNYHAWLTPAQFGQRFGVADADVQKVAAWLSQKGFTGIKASPGNMFIEFSGTAGLVRTAFHTEMHNFMVNGEAHVANVSVPQLPAALAPVVAGIHSLHNFRKKSFMHFSQALATAKAEGKLKPGFGNGAGLYAVGPGDFAKIYNLPPTSGAGALNGSGQTIALVARSNIAVSDITQFGTGFGIANLTSFTAANNIIVTGPDPGIVQPDDGEATLDVEWSGAVAPGATILLVVSNNALTTFADGVDLSALYIVENNLAPIVSESFGLCEPFSDNNFDINMWEQAAAQGMTVMVSAGDNGSASCDPDQDPNASTDGLAISGTASTPFNVAVGGTDFDDASNPTTYWNNTAALETAKGYIPEIPWNDTCASGATVGNVTGFCTTVNQDGLDLVAGSGGASQVYVKPAWQSLSLTGMPNDGSRDIPDVSLFAAVNSASNNFYVICLADSLSQNGQPCNLTGSGTGYSYTGVGGTSAASPAFAGIIALVNQSLSLPAGKGQGNVNYVLYPLAAAQQAAAGTKTACNSNGATLPVAACTFNDVTKGNNSVACDGGFAAVGCSVTGAGTTGILLEAPVPPYTLNAPAWAATAGYDLATGLGSVNVANLVKNWTSITTGFLGSTTTITAPASVNGTHGATVSFAITVAQKSGTAVPTGDVSLIASPPGSAQVGIPGATIAANGTVTIPTDFLPGGTAYPVVAHYGGDGTFAASDSAPVSVTVAKEPSKVSAGLVTLDVNSGAPTYNVTTAPYGSSYILFVNVTNNSGTPCVPPFPTTQGAAFPTTPCPTGTITLNDNGAPLKDFINTGSANTNTATLNTQGFAEDAQVQLIGGAHSLVAGYGGDNSFSLCNSPITTPLPACATAASVTISAATTSTGVTANGQSAVTVSAGSNVTLAATVTGFYTSAGACANGCASSGAGPTGSVVFKNGTTTIATVPNVVPTAFNPVTGATAFSTATTSVAFSTTGVQTISATFTTADTNYTGSASSGVGNATVTVNAAGTFAVSYSPQPLVLNSATGAASTLTVTVTPSGGFTGMVAVTPTAASLPPGVSCTPSPLNINVTAAAAVTGQLMCSVTATSTTLTASVAREDRMQEAKAVPPTTGSKGWWTLSAGTGFAALFLFFLPGERKKFRAALGLGLVCILTLTAGCNGAGGGVKPPPPTMTTTKLTANTGKVANGTAFTFSAAVTGGTPTGMVQLFDGATMIGTAASVAGGTAVPTAPALAVGTHAISAHYLGDLTTAASASGTLNLTVTGSTTIAITSNPVATPAAPAITVTVQ
jgi:Pro-kumamolisin, activation domain/Bacterial Ig-like domain (group 3)